MRRTIVLLIAATAMQLEATAKVLTADNVKAVNAGLRTNEGAAHVLVQDNEITFGNIVCTLCRDYSAIYVTEGGMANPNSAIRNNTIHFVNSGSSRYGINLLSADDWLVAENTLLMADNALNETGIWLQGCRRAEVSCNTITGASTSYPNARQAAIRNAMGSDALISCNDVDKTTNGIIFTGVAYGTDVRGNKLRRHKWALHLDATAIIDAQVLKGNLWHHAPEAGGIGAWYEVSDVQSVQSAFFVNPATIDGGNTQPPSWSPQDWFESTGGVNYDCADDEAEDYCSQFSERDKDRLTELDERVANDSLANDPYTDESKWILKSSLYKKLDENPEMLDSLQLMAAFYDELQGSTTAAFKAIDDEQLALYDMDSSVVAQLQANRAQIEAFMALIKDGMAELSDSTLTAAQRQAILSGIGGYRQNIRDLSTWNAMAMEVAAASKVLTADGIKAANTGVGATELIEANQQAINEIYLSTVGKDVDTVTTAQISALFDIANQCSMIGGNAVFKARSLYWWKVDDAQEFDDQLLCLPHGIIVKSMEETPPNAVTVVPNPASDEATLVLTQVLGEPGILVLYDAIGAEVVRHIVPKDMTRFAFNTGMLAPAMYHYRMLRVDSVIGTGKLGIVR